LSFHENSFQLIQHKNHISNWEYNRPPDLERSKDIAEAISQKKNDIDWVLHIVYNSVKNQFHIIDGIHRFYALICMVESEQNFEWLQNQNILLNIRKDLSKGESIDWFYAINNCNPVPDLYLRDIVQEKRICIETLVKEWQEKYPLHFMSSKKPNSGHINRDQFIEILDVLYDKYEKQNNIIPMMNLLREKLIERNEVIRQNIPSKITAKSLEKCSNSGCYLFLYKPEYLTENI
jgi:hypothetical protein